MLLFRIREITELQNARKSIRFVNVLDCGNRRHGGKDAVED
jgi:hypothetical protein